MFCVFEHEIIGYTFDFAVVDEVPTVLYKGDLYQYRADGDWILLEDIEKVKQIVNAENLQYLDVNGKLHIEEYMSSMEAEMKDADEKGLNFPMTAGHSYYIAGKALEANEKDPFEMMSGDAPIGFMALLSDGKILYQDLKGFHTYEFKEKIAMLSDYMVLTTAGDVYRFVVDDSKPSKWEVDIQKVYDGGNATYIYGWQFGDYMAGLTRDGKAILWSRFDTPDISDWENLATIVHGNSFVAALTNEHKVLYKHYDEEVSLQVEKIVCEWKDIAEIASFGDRLYAIDRDGNCYGVEIKGLAYGSDDWEVKTIIF